MLKKDIFNDIWFLYKKYSEITTDSEWGILVKEEQKLVKKYNKDPYLMDMLYALNNEIGRNKK